MRALPYNSQAKGVVERVNQIYTGAAKALPSYIGRDMDKEARLLVFKQMRADLKTAGRSRLLTSWEAFCEHIEATIAAYNNKPHRSLAKIHDAQLGAKRHLTPNEFWRMKTDGVELIVPDQAELDLMFRPYEVRRANRGLVQLYSNSYFAIELEPYHGQDVIVGFDLHDASRVWVREIERTDDGHAPGRLIAVARFEGNKARYVPVSVEQRAIETRAKGQLARVARKREEIEAQLRPFNVLELRPNAPAAITPAASQLNEIPAAPAAGEAGSGFACPQKGPISLPGDRPVIGDDASLARWLLAHPDRVDAADRELLRDLLTTPSSLQLLRMSGLDLDALRQLARSNGASEAEQGITT
jgi:putative transposase